MADASMHRYRSRTCGALRKTDIGTTARLSGWVHRVRDHGGLLFVDLRDHYGLTQVVVDPDTAAFKTAERLRSEAREISGDSCRPWPQQRSRIALCGCTAAAATRKSTSRRVFSLFSTTSPSVLT